ncbi:MAG: DUF349 domain-containing protein, partial [Oscillospiraceae bacterium]|nr:DUF349 domain-containing protein [Oscillospiraceae bacterium]
KLPELPAPLEEQLSARFFNGLKAAANRNAAYVRRLENNTADLRDGLLLNEILFSVPTPAKYEEARTKKQLEVLQSSLSGAERPDGMSVFKAVAAMPALLEREDIDRICRLVPQLIDKK